MRQCSPSPEGATDSYVTQSDRHASNNEANVSDALRKLSVHGAYLRPEDPYAFAPKARSVPARGKSAESGATARRRPGKPTQTAEPLCKSGSRRLGSNRIRPPTYFVRTVLIEHSGCVLTGRKEISPHVPGRRSPSARLRSDLPRAVGAKTSSALMVVTDWAGGCSASCKCHLLGGVALVPEGHMTLAQGFSLGLPSSNGFRPGGTVEGVEQGISLVSPGEIAPGVPKGNGAAISCPFGTYFVSCCAPDTSVALGDV
jgi:hypothetical protein